MRAKRSSRPPVFGFFKPAHGLCPHRLISTAVAFSTGVPYRAISNSVQALPFHASVLKPGGPDVKNIASMAPGKGPNQILTRQTASEVGTARRAVRGRLGEATPPKPELPPAGDKDDNNVESANVAWRIQPMQPLLARNSTNAAFAAPLLRGGFWPQRPGLVVDYQTLDAGFFGDGTTNFVFQGDTTYLVTGEVFLDGYVTFEGGCVCKFSGSDACLIPYGNTNPCYLGDTYRPTVFTSSDDNTVGAVISGSSGNPSQDSATYINDIGGSGNAMNVAIQHARFAYAGTAYFDEYDDSHVVSDCQFFNCGMDVSAWGDSNVCFLNVLSIGGTLNYEAYNGLNYDVTGIIPMLDCENLTIDGGNIAQTGDGGPFAGGITNSSSAIAVHAASRRWLSFFR
jgi:hypothetical protein